MSPSSITVVFSELTIVECGNGLPPDMLWGDIIAVSAVPRLNLNLANARKVVKEC